MARTKPPSITHLFLNKILGCYQQFGMKETLRRIFLQLKQCITYSNASVDISFITDKLMIGAAPKSIDALEELKRIKIDNIIDLRVERKKSDILVNVDGIFVHWIPIADNWKPINSEHFRNLAHLIKNIYSIKEDTKLFICCNAGKHRAPLAGILALTINDYSLERAISIIQKARPVAEILPVYKASLLEFIETHANHL